MDGVTGEDGIRRYYGKYPGRVLQNAAPASGDHRGDLLVEVPGFLEDVPGGTGRRPLQVTARPCFPPGLFWVPAVGQPVWVEFAAGSLDHPIWSGVWYPADQAPRTTAGKAPGTDQKVLQTAGGHTVEFDDTGSAPRLAVTDAAGNQVVLSAQQVEIRTGKDTAKLVIALGSATIEFAQNTGITITDGNNHTIAMTSSGVEISGPRGSTNRVVLADLVDIFKNHMHMTAMGPAALSPADTAQVAAKQAAGTLVSQAVKVE